MVSATLAVSMLLPGLVASETTFMELHDNTRDSGLNCDGLNCFAGMGGDPMTTQDAPVYHQVGLVECQQACDSVPSCVAIVHQKNLSLCDSDYGVCWLRKAVRPAECAQGLREFHTHVRVQRYLARCSLGHGGEPLGELLRCHDDVGPGDYSTNCEDDGLQACLATDGCVAWWQNTSGMKHFGTERYFQLFSSVDLAECALPEETEFYDSEEWTYALDAVKSSSRSVGLVGQTTFMKLNDNTHDYYDSLRDGVNCFAGKGGDPMTTQDAPVYHRVGLAECQSACDSVPSCVAIVHQKLTGYGACFHRKAVRPAECEIDRSGEFQTHVRVHQYLARCSLAHGGEPLGELLSCHDDGGSSSPGASCEDHGLRACLATDGCVAWWQNTSRGGRSGTDRNFQLFSSVDLAECALPEEDEEGHMRYTGRTYALDAVKSSSPSLV